MGDSLKTAHSVSLKVLRYVGKSFMLLPHSVLPEADPHFGDDHGAHDNAHDEHAGALSPAEAE